MVLHVFPLTASFSKPVNNMESPLMAWLVWCSLATSVVRVRFSAIPLRGQRCVFLVIEVHSRRGSEVT